MSIDVDVFDRAQALADETGIGVERAMVLIQRQDRDREAVAEAWEQVSMAVDAMVEAIRPLVVAFCEVMTKCNAIFPAIVEAHKRDQRRKRHASWQARNVRRR